ncbi:hypothetical protein KC325_g316 [Hortaea werneckii]|nr:hypothetical protein KC325_g316 [Hortaea werneckii]
MAVECSTQISLAPVHSLPSVLIDLRIYKYSLTSVLFFKCLSFNSRPHTLMSTFNSTSASPKLLQSVMTARNLNISPVTNLERFLVTRYRSAHALLETDADAAEQALLVLLQEPRLPLWMRVQCNLILAGITEDYNEAMCYLRDARTSLRLFKERYDEETPLVLQMEEALDGIEVEIEERKETGFQSGSDSTSPTPRAASTSEASGQRHEYGLAASQREGTQPGDAANDGMLLGFGKAGRAHRSNSKSPRATDRSSWRRERQSRRQPQIRRLVAKSVLKCEIQRALTARCKTSAQVAMRRLRARCLIVSDKPTIAVVIWCRRRSLWRSVLRSNFSLTHRFKSHFKPACVSLFHFSPSSDSPNMNQKE